MCDFIKTVKTNTNHHTPPHTTTHHHTPPHTTTHHHTPPHTTPFGGAELHRALLAIVTSGNTSYRANRDHSNL
jgi:hypothetical protein